MDLHLDSTGHVAVGTQHSFVPSSARLHVPEAELFARLILLTCSDFVDLVIFP